MARTPELFGAGTLSTASTVLAGPVPLAETWYVTQLDGQNTGSSDATVTFSVNTGGSIRQLTGGLIDASGGSYAAIEKALILGPGDTLLGLASIASVVTFYAAGIRSA